MKNDTVEEQLKRLGEVWPPDESFVERIVSRIESELPRANASRSAANPAMRIRYVAVAAVIACIGLWWSFGPQNTGSVLYAQVKEALKQVQTIHEVATVQTDDGEMRRFAETWFARGKGFSLVRDDQIRVDNGTFFWEHKSGSQTASRTKSLGTDELLDQALNLREQLERDCERYPGGDRKIDGERHDCYRLTFHGAVKPADPSFLDFNKRRTLIFISPTSLPARAEMAEKVDGVWKTRLVRTWEYNVPVEPEMFEPHFAQGVRVIDIDEAFEQLTAVENAVYTEQREGLVYAIHRAKRFENGGVMILSSVRGTENTLRQYPLTRRRLQPGLFITDGPATNWHASPQGSGYFRLKLAEANHLGVDAQWWIMVPRGRLPNWFEDTDGRVQLKIGITPRGEYAKANHADENGVIQHISWDLALEIPKPDQLPTLNDIAAQVHSDLSMLQALIFPGQLNLGVKEVDGTPTGQFGSVADVSPEQFSRATREHWLWWQSNDVDFQLKSGGTSGGSEIGASEMKPAVMVNYNFAVDDSTFARAAERKNLAVISARGTKITDVGLVHLTGLTKLKKLDIANTLVTDDGLRHLNAMTSLENINLTGTQVTKAGVDRLREKLPNAEIVTSEDNTSAKPPATIGNSEDPQPLPSIVTGMVMDTGDQPVAEAQVTVLVRTFKKDMHEELNGSQAWTTMTDENGRYSISPTGTVNPHNEVRIKVVAKGFADVSGVDDEKRILDGVLPQVRMLPGRRISGRLVDQDGNAVEKAIVRFYSCNEDATARWGSGPFPVHTDGRFSLSVPSDGMAAGTIYPAGLAPRFIEVTSEADQGDIVLEKGVALDGRVVDRDGRGVANTVVGIRKAERRIMHLSVAVIGMAVRTDESGHFRLPPLLGAYKLSVGRSLPDFSRQMMLEGETPPSIEPITIEFGRSPGEEEIILREPTP